MCKFFNLYEESLHLGVCKLAKYVRTALFSGKIYTSDKNFTRPPVATVATNSKSDQSLKTSIWLLNIKYELRIIHEKICKKCHKQSEFLYFVQMASRDHPTDELLLIALFSFWARKVSLTSMCSSSYNILRGITHPVTCPTFCSEAHQPIPIAFPINIYI